MKIRKPSKKMIFGIAVALAALLCIPFVLQLNVEDVLQYTPAYPLLAALVIVGIYAAKSVFMFIPLLVLYLAAGRLFPPAIAVLVSAAGLAVELTITYFLGRYLGKDKVTEKIAKHKKAETFFAFTSENVIYTCFICRLVPLPLPLDLVSMFFGASGFRFWKYLLFSLMGLFPSMFLTVIAGNYLHDPFSKEFLIPFIIDVVFIVLTAGIMLWIRSRKKKSKQSGNNH